MYERKWGVRWAGVVGELKSPTYGGSDTWMKTVLFAFPNNGPSYDGETYFLCYALCPLV